MCCVALCVVWLCVLCGSVCLFLGKLTKTNACPVGTDGFVSLKLLVSACLMLLYQVGVRVKLTLRPLTVLPRVYRWTRGWVTAGQCLEVRRSCR